MPFVWGFTIFGMGFLWTCMSECLCSLLQFVKAKSIWNVCVVSSTIFQIPMNSGIKIKSVYMHPWLFLSKKINAEKVSCKGQMGAEESEMKCPRELEEMFQQWSSIRIWQTMHVWVDVLMYRGERVVIEVLLCGRYGINASKSSPPQSGSLRELAAKSSVFLCMMECAGKSFLSSISSCKES